MAAKVEIIKAFAQIILYLALGTFFICFYMLDQMSDYFKSQTTEAKQTDVPTTVLEPPTLTICLNPSLKTSVAKELGIATNDEADFLFKE